MKLRYRIIFFLIGLAGIGVMLWQSDLKNVPWENLLAAKTLLFLAGLLVLWLVIYMIHVACYYVILGKEGKKVPVLSMLKICISGFALNSVTPAGLIGGEPYRIMSLKKYCSTEKASSSTLTFSLFHIVGHFAIWLTGAVVYFAAGHFGDTVTDILMILTVVVTSLFLVAFFLSKRRGFVRPFMALLTKIPLLKKPMKKKYDKNAAKYCEIDQNIRVFRNTRSRFWTVFFLQYLTRLLECVEYFLIFRYLGAKIYPLDGILIMIMASLIGNLIVFIPMQAGSRELGAYMALDLLHIEQIGPMGLILYRIREFLCIMLGVLLIVFDKNKEKAETNPAETPPAENGADGEQTAPEKSE